MRKDQVRNNSYCRLQEPSHGRITWRQLSQSKVPDCLANT